jgi:hypothetical protein
MLVFILKEEDGKSHTRVGDIGPWLKRKALTPFDQK